MERLKRFGLRVRIAYKVLTCRGYAVITDTPKQDYNIDFYYNIDPKSIRRIFATYSQILSGQEGVMDEVNRILKK